MRNVLILGLMTLWAISLKAQTDSIRTPKPQLLEQRINAARLELKSSFINQDPAGAGLWLDSLNRLEDDSYIGVNWDERWLLYYWAENYGALLAETSQFGANERNIQAWKVPPPADSLFEIIDSTMYERRFDQFQNIRHAFLNDEEKAFSTLLLEYLLRMNKDEDDWAERLDAFENKYPASRFNYFLGSVKPALLKPANKGFGLSMQFVSGSWSKEIERSLNPLFAAQFDCYYWVDRWNITLNALFGGPRLARAVTDGEEIWPKNDPTSFASFGLELGYDIVNNSKVRIFPAIGGALASLKPPTPDEDSEEEVPSYYDNFTFLEGHFTASITADAKLFGKNHRDWGVPKGSYHGVRLRVGYNFLNFKGQNEMLGGNLFYFAVGYNLFAFNEARKK